MQLLDHRRLILACVVVLCAAAGSVALLNAGRADADLSNRISDAAKRAEYLRGAVAQETAKIRSSTRGLAAAQRRLGRLQADTAAQEAELRAVRTEFVRARNRLTRLVNLQRDATGALRANLQSAYREPQPDIVSVIVNARGFTDLLEQADFLQRIARRNARIMDVARTTKARVTRQTERLGEMQAREQAAALTLQRKRDAAQVVETAFLRERERYLARSAFRRGELHAVQSKLAALREQLARTARAGIPTNSGGLAQPPPGAPPQIALVMAAGNAIAGLPYAYGGGHGSFRASAYDCSGSVSYALAAAGLVSSPMASGPFMTWGDPGPGRWITVYANPGHAFMVVAGWRFDTSALGGGTRWTRSMRPTGGFVARHPPGL